MPSRFDDQAEWIETDGCGGFASGTVSGIRTRRYHAILLSATTPPTGRFVLVNGFDAWVTTPGGSYALSSQYYGGGVTHPDGYRRIGEFERTRGRDGSSSWKTAPASDTRSSRAARQ